LQQYRQELILDGRRYLSAYGILAIEPLLVVPLLLATLQPAQIGVLGAVEALIVVLCGLTQLGVKFAYLQHVADTGQEDRAAGFWTATMLTGVAGMLAGLIAATLFDLATDSGIIALSVGVSAGTLGALLALTNLHMMLVTDLRAKRNPLPVVFSSAVRLVLTVSLMAVFLPGAAHPLDVVLGAQALALLAASGLLLTIGRMPPIVPFRPCLAKSFVAYGWPIATGSLIKYGTDALVPWLCLALVSPVAAGALALAARTAAIFDTVFGLPFLMAWGGRVYEWLNDKASHAHLRTLFWQIAGWALLAIALSWIAGVGVLTLSGDTAAIAAAALWLLPLSLAGKALFVLRSPASSGLLVDRDMRWNIGYALAGLLAFGMLGPIGFLSWGAAGGMLAFVAVEAVIVLDMARRGLRRLSVGCPPSCGRTAEWSVTG
jgi:O-antigen/teichoic acid export membrane protein